jgi:hypothetical protein
MEGSGWLWLLVAIGIVALGVAMAYATNKWRKARMNSSERERTEQATRENYRRDG